MASSPDPIDPWEPADAGRVWAFQTGDVLTLVASGIKPGPCWRVKIVRALIAVDPPEFAVVWRQQGVCAFVAQRYRVSERFRARPGLETIRVRTRRGVEDVPVRQLELAPFGKGFKALRDEARKKGPDLYTGYSSRTFEEAYSDAIRQIPIRFPDELINVEVVAQGGSHGGFAGIQQLFVTVRRADELVEAKDDHEGRETKNLAAASTGEEGARPTPCGHVERYRAEQVPGAVIIHADGEHPTAGWLVYFEQLPIRIFPPQYEVVHVKPTGPVAEVITPFSIFTSFGASERIDEVVVHDAHGEHTIKVEQVPD